MRPLPGRWLVLLAFSASVLACNSDGTADASTPDAATPPVRIPVTVSTESGDVVFQAEIADSPEKRRVGLMDRASMERTHAMLFLFPREGQLSFWMKNTLIPLDMLFIKSDKTIRGIVENATPRTETPRRVEGPTQFVLEINGGLSAEMGIKAGQKVNFFAPIPSQ